MTQQNLIGLRLLRKSDRVPMMKTTVLVQFYKDLIANSNSSNSS